MRYELLDGLRGFFLLNMLMVHLPSLNIFLPKLNHHRLGFVEDAQGFVFLSGLVIGIVYTRKLTDGSFLSLSDAMKARLITVFKHHCFLAVMIAVGAFVFRDQIQLNPFFATLTEAPLLTGILTIVSIAGPNYIDILPMYIAFMILSPIAIYAIYQGYWVLVVGASVTAWLVAQTGIIELMYSYLEVVTGAQAAGVKLGIFFNRLGWQIVYFPALTLGVLYKLGRINTTWLQSTLSKALLIPAVAVSLICFGLQIFDTHIVANTASASFISSIDRATFGALRVANFFAWLHILSWIVVAAPNEQLLLMRKLSQLVHSFFTLRPFVFLGQHSLPVYTFHVVLVYAVALFAADIVRTPWFARELFAVMCALLLFLPAIFQERLKRKRLAPT